MSEGTQRKLAAIPAADTVGYSRLMEADEAGTPATMKAHRAELRDGMRPGHSLVAIATDSVTSGRPAELGHAGGTISNARGGQKSMHRSWGR
jgi:hypothetical protein